jgi:hypothetical protein
MLKKPNTTRVREFIHFDAKFGSIEGYICPKDKANNLSIE